MKAMLDKEVTNMQDDLLGDSDEDQKGKSEEKAIGDQKPATGLKKEPNQGKQRSKSPCQLKAEKHRGEEKAQNEMDDKLLQEAMVIKKAEERNQRQQ